MKLLKKTFKLNLFIVFVGFRRLLIDIWKKYRHVCKLKKLVTHIDIWLKIYAKKCLDEIIRVFSNLTKVMCSNIISDTQQHLNTYKKFIVYLGPQTLIKSI